MEVQDMKCVSSSFVRATYVAVFSVLPLLAIDFASAQPPGFGQPGFGPPGFGRPGFGPQSGFLRMLPLMKALDADESGDISAEEIQGAAEALKSLDKNQDGKLTEDELRPQMGRGGDDDRGGPGPGPSGFGRQNPESLINDLMKLDRNEDGKLDADELGERRAGMMSRADSDKDGLVTREELVRMMSSMARGRGRPEAENARERQPRERQPRGEQQDKDEPGDRPQDERRQAEAGNRVDRGTERRTGTGPGPEVIVERMLQFDADKDGKLSRDELVRMVEDGMNNRGPGFGGPGFGGPGFGGRGFGGPPERDRPRRPEAE
jgi:Ca2+-binding EF-hand superfamily protein